MVSFQRAIQFEPENDAANINLGNILSKQGNFKEAIKVLQIPLNKNPKNREALNSMVGVLNYYSPEAAVDGSHADLQGKLRKIEPASIETRNISDEAIQKLYEQFNAETTFTGLSHNDYAETQIWRGKPYYLGCDRHFAVFNHFNVIPRYCFDCYKVYVEPRTVVELFKLMIVFDSIDLPGDKARKCMVETRKEIAGAYKGYIYCQGRDEGMKILKLVRDVVTDRISKNVQVALKRGCSEYALSYPEFVQNDEDGNSALTYKEEWVEHEDYADKNMVKHIYPPVVDSYNHAGLTLRDSLVMNNWLAYAAAIGDLSYMGISGAPVEKLRIDKRPGFQFDKE